MVGHQLYLDEIVHCQDLSYPGLHYIINTITGRLERVPVFGVQNSEFRSPRIDEEAKVGKNSQSFLVLEAMLRRDGIMGSPKKNIIGIIKTYGLRHEGKAYGQ